MPDPAGHQLSIASYQLSTGDIFSKHFLHQISLIGMIRLFVYENRLFVDYGCQYFFLLDNLVLKIKQIKFFNKKTITT